jgi:hypothetical protein
MGLMALAAGAKWPRGRELWPHILLVAIQAFAFFGETLAPLLQFP